MRNLLAFVTGAILVVIIAAFAPHALDEVEG